jgi:hypothetical protein
MERVMSGEQQVIDFLLQLLDDAAVQNHEINGPYLEDILFTQLLTRLAARRTEKDILHQVQYHLNFEQRNLSKDEFVVTRGC